MTGCGAAQARKGSQQQPAVPQIEESRRAHEMEVSRLEGESGASQAALADLQATCGQHTAAMTLLEHQRNEERAHRRTRPPPPLFPQTHNHTGCSVSALSHRDLQPLRQNGVPMWCD